MTFAGALYTYRVRQFVMVTPRSALVVVTLAAAACAHAPRPEWKSETIDGDHDAVVVRYGGDREIADRVGRAVRVALPIAERWGRLTRTVTLTIHPTHEALEEAAHHPGYAWLRAWARADSIEMQSPRTWSRGDASDDELVQLVTHELTHCVMYQAIGGDPRRALGIPVWFREGMATSTAGERFAMVHHATRRVAGPVRRGALLYESELVYATADQAFRFLVRRFGAARVRQILATVHDGLDFPDAFREVTGVGLTAFEQEFDSFQDQAVGTAVDLATAHG